MEEGKKGEKEKNSSSNDGMEKQKQGKRLNLLDKCDGLTNN